VKAVVKSSSSVVVSWSLPDEPNGEITRFVLFGKVAQVKITYDAITSYARQEGVVGPLPLPHDIFELLLVPQHTTLIKNDLLHETSREGTRRSYPSSAAVRRGNLSAA
jgi:hypothetical protein